MVISVGAQILRSHSTTWPTESSQIVDLRKPRVFLKETSLDLGVLDPDDECSHIFVVQNEGDAPLKITKAGTSCKCTISMLPAGDIPPGRGGPIEVESKNDAGDGPFSHTASFATNDPDKPIFELTIQGSVRKHIAANPPVISVSNLKRNEPVEMSAFFISEAWDAFSLENVTSNIEGLSWEFKPAQPQQLRECQAKSGYVATFRLPADRVGSGFSGWVEADAQPTGKQGESRKVRISLSGRAASIRSVFGPSVDREGVVTIGTLSRGQGAKVPLVLQVRGKHREIHVQEIQKTPNFLSVTVAAQNPELAKKGIYYITVEVPRNAPPCNFMTENQQGTLQVLTDHPEMPEIVKLKVAFAVLSE
jgi:hypothetical protein